MIKIICFFLSYIGITIPDFRNAKTRNTTTKKALFRSKIFKF